LKLISSHRTKSLINSESLSTTLAGCPMIGKLVHSPQCRCHETAFYDCFTCTEGSGVRL